MTTLKQYLTSNIYNGRYLSSFDGKLNMSPAGCPYRGTTVCIKCPLSPPELCDYRCQSRRARVDCEHRAYCKCGHDQTHRLKAWGLIE